MNATQQRSSTISQPITRRSAITRLAATAITGAATATVGLQAVRAQEQSSVAEDRGRAIYTLAGDDIELICDFTLPDGPRMELHGRLGDGTFEGQWIETSHHPQLGTMVTATVDWVADAYILYLTLLVPYVNLKAGQEELPISTLAILTKHHQNVGGPNMVKGPLQSHQAIALTGTFRAEGS